MTDRQTDTVIRHNKTVKKTIKQIQIVMCQANNITGLVIVRLGIIAARCYAYARPMPSCGVCVSLSLSVCVSVRQYF